ncbi:unnamed protein product [Zymoseptoria tritici ST99CH_1A5]|uniref:Uncharacterized protein n=4 Tax=Zymoseptoria tritici TaxID=1047171 RepID=A0A1X7S5L7_ZYMT9|nr:unnamed protein product [Zymoseptoria tritici ST99CH_3D7]SMR59241.1 unnamed protein product [Zymoseptoria tritici ST99CH_1E4]SMY28451.1 unnamed protein product [Zymoseptoria tritici ST99CH_1A5]
MHPDSHDANANGDNNASTITTAEARLRQEAFEMRQKPLAATRPARDITEGFVNATKQLPPGVLVKDAYFTLFEAVGALEIMDSKMDSGYIPAGDTFEATFDVCSPLDAAEVLWIMDEIFRLELIFHDGYPLSQNLFTSLHIFRLLEPDNRYPYNFRYDVAAPGVANDSTNDDLVHVVLRAYCIAVIKCCELTLNMIQSQTFYEEEDFVTYLFGRELLDDMEPQETLRILVDAMDWVDSSDLEGPLKFAIKHRLVAREDMLIAMDGRDEQWVKVKSKIGAMEKHHSLAKPTPDAFSDKVQRQLATSTPPRPMPQLDWHDAHKKWLQFCDDMLAIQALTAPSVRQSPQCLLNATWAFAYRDPVPNTYARATMQDVLTGENNVAGDVSHFDLMLNDLRDLVLPGDPLADPESFQIEVPTDVRHQASRLIEEFMNRMFSEYLNIYRTICQNRCRTRRLFTQAVPLLDELECDARAADEHLNSIVAPRKLRHQGMTLTLTPFSLWTRFYKLQISAWVIQLGFETDLYLPSEFCMMYILLGSFCTMRESIVKSLALLADRRLEDLVKMNGSQNYIEQCRSSKQWYHSLCTMAKGTLGMAYALQRLYLLLEHTKLIDTSPKPYEESQMRHEARMKPLLNLANNAEFTLGYVQDMKEESLASTIKETCDFAQGHINTARHWFSEQRTASPMQARCVGTEDRWKRELKSLETVCVATSVAISQLLHICEKHGKRSVDTGVDLRSLVEVTIPPPGKRYHDWWVVPQLKEKS